MSEFTGSTSAHDAAEVQRLMAAGLTRRQALKRAGLVGAATIWATPVVQTVFAGSAAASPGGQPGCTGASDTTNSCGGSGNCPQCGAGGTCGGSGNIGVGGDCLSGNCQKVNGKFVCQPSAVGGKCRVSNDCATNLCTGAVSNGFYTCSKASFGSGNCSVAGDCTTNNCNTANGTCRQSGVGGACATTSDCSAGTCQSGVCR